MTPEQIAALTAIASIIAKIGTWPVGSIAAVIVFGPWVIMLLMMRGIEKRHAAVVQMYEANVKLVEGYQTLSGEHVDTIRLSTAAITDLTTFLKTKVPCHQFINLSSLVRKAATK